MRRILLLLLALSVVWPSSVDAQSRFRRRVLHARVPAQADPPDVPTVTLTSPVDDADDRSVSLTLNYTTTGSPTLCTLYLDTTGVLTTPVATDAACDGSFASADYGGPLDYETQYYWKVTAHNSEGDDTTTARNFTTAAMGALSLLTTADLTCAGMFFAPGQDIGQYSVSFPNAVKVSGSTRTYFTFNGATGHVWRYDEPTLSPCNTALASITVASTGFTDYGAPVVANGNGHVPPYINTSFWGLNYDAVRNGLWVSWISTYTDVAPGNNFAFLTLGSGSNTTVGCWSLNARSGTVGMPMGGSGVITIPDWFVDAHLSAGHNLGVGMGGNFSSVTSGNSYGPSIEAIATPAPNACTADTDTFLATAPVLARYPTNVSSNIPTCAGSGLGCDTSGMMVTTPYAAQMAYAGYSYDQYASDWDPSGGHGWWSSFTGGNGNWYDDGSKTGFLYALGTTSGWLKQTILASPAPTGNGTTVAFSVASTSTHDGANLQAGDLIWVTTCTVGVAGCSTTNADDKAFVIVDTVNTSTGAVTGHITVCAVDSNNDCIVVSGGQKPVAGGEAWEGAIYSHGSPRPSRATMRLQIYDPADFAAVVDGDPTYSPVYAEEVDLSAYVPQLGCPGCAIPGLDISGGPSSVQVDPDNHKVIIFFRNGKTAIGVSYTLGVVFDVAH